MVIFIFVAGLFYGFVFGMMYESYLQDKEYLEHEKYLKNKKGV